MTSPSAEVKAQKLAFQYEGLLFYRLPLVTDSRLSWDCHSLLSLKPPKYFLMVRYDFFPLLLFIASRKETYSILLNATVKNKKMSPLYVWYCEQLYRHFDKIYWSNDRDLEVVLKSGMTLTKKQTLVSDFRHQHIIERQKNKANLLALGHQYEELLCHLENIPYEKRLILGSAWASEIRQLKPSLERLMSLGFFIFVAPHNLSGSEVTEIATLLHCGSVWDKERPFKKSSLVIALYPGLLCELYPLFAHCYVGGGFIYSVHSLLEPYWAGGQLYHGPKIERSTEYDYIHERARERLCLISNENSFDDFVLKHLPLEKIDLTREKESIMKLYSVEGVLSRGERDA